MFHLTFNDHMSKALNDFKDCINIACHPTTVDSSLARVTCETSQALLTGGLVVFLWDRPFFAPPYD